MSNAIVIYSAKKIHTFSDTRQTATHVAVKDGRIMGVGSLDDLTELGPYRLDSRYETKFIMPGMIEGHSHVLAGHLWRYVYLGFYDRVDPNGKLWTGLKSIQDIVKRLKKYAGDDATKPIIGWGFDPIFFNGTRMVTSDLDQISTTRPAFILHASGHCLNANSYILDQANIDEDTNVEGVIKNDNQQPTGELREMAAMFAAFEVAGHHIFDVMGSEEDLWAFSKITQRAGVTTATELYSPLNDEVVEAMVKVTADKDFPLRLVAAKSAVTSNPESDISRVDALKSLNTDKLFFGPIKIMTDGSIQGFTARLKSGRYHNGASNGIWNAPPEEITSAIGFYHQVGIQLHIHTNGDEAIELVIDAIETANMLYPNIEHGHVLQHCQLITRKMLDRCAQIGIGTNIFANHIYYWGDQHAAHTIGPEKAEMLDPVGEALESGVNFAIHSDAPITPLAPLFTAWCAVNRLTSSGKVLGPDQCITVDDALYTITMGAARSLKMDHLIGSIETGKYADFSILDDDPLVVDPLFLKDITVDGVVIGGVPFTHFHEQQ